MVEDGRIPHSKNAAELGAYSRRIARLRRILPVIAIFLLGLLVIAFKPDFVRKAGQDAPEKRPPSRLRDCAARQQQSSAACRTIPCVALLGTPSA